MSCADPLKMYGDLQPNRKVHIYNMTTKPNQTDTMLFNFQEPLFPARVVYDLVFYFIVIIIVLNLIFGVIIDTFADLRSEKQKKEEILKTTCFICGTE